MQCGFNGSNATSWCIELVEGLSQFNIHVYPLFTHNASRWSKMSNVARITTFLSSIFTVIVVPTLADNPAEPPLAALLPFTLSFH